MYQQSNAAISGVHVAIQTFSKREWLHLERQQNVGPLVIMLFAFHTRKNPNYIVRYKPYIRYGNVPLSFVGHYPTGYNVSTLEHSAKVM